MRPRKRSESVLRRRGRASAELATALRRELVRWASALNLPAAVVGDIALAGYEAMANTVLHAYPRGTLGVLELRARLTLQALTVTVVDRGRWRTDAAVRPGQEPGHGLPIIRELPDHTEIAAGEHGTSVSMVWREPGLRRRPRQPHMRLLS
jgi:serine/threonine-protein kinase RsbW